jgi:hypothetical protein
LRNIVTLLCDPGRPLDRVLADRFDCLSGAFVGGRFQRFSREVWQSADFSKINGRLGESA